MINVNLLPKNLRRREPGYWRLIAVLFPLVVLSIAGSMQFTANQTERARLEEKDLRELKLAALQPDIEEQQRLQARQQQLSELIAVRNAVQQGRIDWTDEIAGMLETLPPLSASGQPRVELNSLSMRALDGQPNPNYDGVPTKAELSVAGTAISSEVLADYIHSLERSPLFAVALRDASRAQETGFYQFNLTVGSLAGGEQ